RAAERGLLVKNVDAMEKALRAKYIVFDKTGTLTLGSPKVVKYIGDEGALALAASAESKSLHPLARAVVEYARALGLVVREPEFYDSFPGMGVYAKVDGRVVAVGNEKLVENMGAEVPAELKEAAQAFRSQGCVAVYVVVDGSVRGLIAVGDELRPEVSDVLRRLRSLGLEPVVLSGDDRRTVELVSKSLGIGRFYGNADPEAKAKILADLKREGPVIFVGDGVNDAPALAAADVGIAVSNSAEVAKEAGDVVIKQGDLGKVLEFLELSKKVLRTARFNLLWAFAYNAVLMPIAAGLFYPALYLRPEFAGLAMSLSSITVTLNALRLRKA
ncbi:MAG: HAD-IC family P-type ATPase, partial [Thermoproteus sp.]